MNPVKLQNVKSTHKNQLHFYTLTMNNPKRELSNSNYNSIKKNKILGNKPNQGGERLIH